MQALKELWVWATDNGAKLDNIAPLALDSGDRIVVASREIKDREEIARIPPEILMSETKAAASVVGVAIRKSVSVDCTEFSSPRALGLLQLIVFMVHEGFEKGRDSFYHPYLSTLPTSFPTLPYYFTDDELGRFIGNETNLVKTVRSKLAILRKGFEIAVSACSEHFSPGTLTWDNFLWAFANISSRAFPLLSPVESPDVPLVATRDPEIAMWPVLDLCNHRLDQPIEWQVSAKDSSVSYVCRERIGIPAGHEILSNYGAKGNEMLLSAYGFLLESNPNDYFKVNLAVDSSRDPLGFGKQRVLEYAKIPTSFLLFADDAGSVQSHGIMAAMRVYCVNSAELLAYADNEDFIGQRNEISALSQLHMLLSRSRERIIQEAERHQGYICQSALEKEKQRMGRCYRDSQVAIIDVYLAKLQASLEKMLPSLQKLIPLDMDCLSSIDYGDRFSGDILELCMDPNGPLDEDSVVTLLIASRMAPREESKEYRVEDEEAYRSHFEEFVEPLLYERGIQLSVGVDQWLQACEYMERNEIALPRDLLERRFPGVFAGADLSMSFILL